MPWARMNMQSSKVDRNKNSTECLYIITNEKYYNNEQAMGFIGV